MRLSMKKPTMKNNLAHYSLLSLAILAITLGILVNLPGAIEAIRDLFGV